MSLTKLSFFLLVNALFTFSSCRSQSKVDVILSKKINSLNTADVSELIKSGYIRKTDAPLIGSLMLSISQNNNSKDWTIKRMLDSAKAKMKQTEDAIALKNNYGRDSVFIRFPNNDKMFIGMGKLSFDKMIDKASQNLPENYTGDYDLKINSSESIKTLGLLISKSENPVITGNVMLYKRDSGQLKNTKIGDIFEISKRIAISKEFAPFANSFN